MRTALGLNRWNSSDAETCVRKNKQGALFKKEAAVLKALRTDLKCMALQAVSDSGVSAGFIHHSHEQRRRVDGERGQRKPYGLTLPARSAGGSTWDLI